MVQSRAGETSVNERQKEGGTVGRCCREGILVVSVVGLVASLVRGDGPPIHDLYRGTLLIAPRIEEELGRDRYGKAWDLGGPDRGNFTSFSAGVQNLEAGAWGLRFLVPAGNVTLGWGNYAGNQPLRERRFLWPAEGDELLFGLRVKQSQPDASRWTQRIWRDGESVGKAATATLAGTEWQVLEFKNGIRPAGDGFELEISGPAGNEITISNLEIIGPIFRGCFRKEFTIPEGRIWRAIANVGNYTDLYVNGQPVPTANGIERRRYGWGWRKYQTTPVDLAPYLRAGPVCLAVASEWTDEFPNAFLMAQVVMEDGRLIQLDTSDEWHVSPHPQPRWTEVGFDDATWPRATARNPLLWYCGGKAPVYDGLLALENPYEDKLFYTAERPVVIVVQMPPGLAPRAQALSWKLHQASLDGNTERSSGEVRDFAQRDGSLVCQVDLGQLPRGVYAFEAALQGENEVIARHPPEPFIVVGKIPMQEVLGDSYAEGMQLESEDTIDFTDPRDPHPWVETARQEDWSAVEPGVTQPRVVRNGALVYRETARLRNDWGPAPMFSYRFQFSKPGAFYLLELEYPNDAERYIGVSVSSPRPGARSKSRTAPAVFTGGKYPLTGRMETLRWIHLATSGPQTLDVVSLVTGLSAAAARVRISRIHGLPALRLPGPGSGSGPERWFGVLTERCFVGGDTGGGVFDTFGPALPSGLPDIQSYGNRCFGDPIGETLKLYCQWFDAAEASAQYLRFAGQNLHVMGAFQYHEHNTGYEPPDRVATARLPYDPRAILVRVLGENGIATIAGIEYMGHRSLRYEYGEADGEVLLGQDTIWPVSATGVPYRGAYPSISGVANFVHPTVQEHMWAVVDDVLEAFKRYPNFLGVHFLLDTQGTWLVPGFPRPIGSDPLGYSYDDATVAKFQQDTGVVVPGEAGNPLRFQKRYAFLTSRPLRDQWVEWRCQQVRDLLAELRRRAREARPDLQGFATVYFQVSDAREWCQSSQPLVQYMRERGLDPSPSGADEAEWVARSLRGDLNYWPPHRQRGHVAAWEHAVGEEPIGLYERDKGRSVTIFHNWHETPYRAPGAKPVGADFVIEGSSDWPVPGNVDGSFQAQASAANAREPFVQALVGSDPELVMFGFTDLHMIVGHEQELREFARVLAVLPKDRFRPVLDTGLETNLAIRDLRKGEAYYFYVANPGCWAISGSVSLSAPSKITNLVNGWSAAAAEDIELDLPPYGVAAFRVDSPSAKVVSWKAEPVAGEQLAHLRGLAADCRRRLEDRYARAILKPDEKRFVQEKLGTAEAGLAAGEYARAWAALSHWRFWTLSREWMPEGQQFGAQVRGAARARSVTYDPRARCLIVCSSEPESPFTLAELLAGERARRWGIVAYRAADDAYRVNAHLVIGREDGTSTYFQVGSKAHPREALIIAGDVRVTPPKASPARSDGWPSVINRLQLGDPDDPTITPTLAFDCSRRGEFGIQLAYEDRSTIAEAWHGGGSLRVYNATITALRQDADHAFGRCVLANSEVRLVNSTISWCAGVAAYRLEGRWHPVEGMTFDHVESALHSGDQYARDCVFRDCGQVVQDAGWLCGSLLRCSFRNNRQNVRYDATQRARQGQFTFVDCDIGPQQEPLVLRGGEDVSTHATLYPTITSQRTLVVTVTDQAGRPVPRAAVEATCEQGDDSAVVRGLAVTGDEGSTPGPADPEARGLLLTEYRLQATDDPARPRETRYTYTIHVSAPGFRPASVARVACVAGRTQQRVVLARE